MIGDQAVRLASMLTTPEQRNTCSSYLGLTRMSHVFCADDYWYTVTAVHTVPLAVFADGDGVQVTFVTLDDYLFDPFLINSVTQPFSSVIVTYTHGDHESLQRAGQLMERYLGCQRGCIVCVHCCDSY